MRIDRSLTSGWRGWTLVIGLSTAVLAGLNPGPRTVQAAQKPPVAPIPITDFLPTTLARDSLRTTLTREVGRPIQLVPPDALLLDALRWAMPSPTDTQCQSLLPKLSQTLAQHPLTASASSPGGPPTTATAPNPPVNRTLPAGELFPALLELARKQFVRVDTQGALTTLELARTVLPCATDIVPPAQLRTLFLLEAATHVYARDNRHTEAFLQLLAVDNRIFLEPEYSPSVQKAFLESAATLSQQKRVRFEPTGGEGSLFLDGLALETARTVPMGRHLLQRQGPNREVKTVLLEPSATEVIQPATLPALSVPDGSRAQSSFVQSLKSGALEPWQQQALDRTLARAGRTQLWCEVEGATGNGSLRIYRAGKGLITLKEAQAELELQEAQAASKAAAVSRPAGPATNPPSPLAKRPAPALGSPVPARPSMSLGLGIQTLRATDKAAVATGMSSGPALQLELPLARVRVGLRAGIYALPLRAASRGDDCGVSPAAGETPTVEQLEAAAACYPQKASLTFGVGAGLPVILPAGLLLTPSLFLEGLLLPEALRVSSEAGGVADQLVGLGALAPVLRLRLSYDAPALDHRLHAWVEPSGGAFRVGAAQSGTLNGAQSGAQSGAQGASLVGVLGGAAGIGLRF